MGILQIDFEDNQTPVNSREDLQLRGSYKVTQRCKSTELFEWSKPRVKWNSSIVKLIHRLN